MDDGFYERNGMRLWGHDNDNDALYAIVSNNETWCR